jgi:hypothetical protein
MHSCKAICPKLCKKYNAQKTKVDTSKPLTESVVKVDNLAIFVKKVIVPFYNSNFDSMVIKTSLVQLQRDKNILQTSTHQDLELSIKINELEEYHNAKSLLSKKYDSFVVENTIKSLKNKQFAGKETDRMISLLENYNFIKKDLSALIQEINQNKKMPDVENYIIIAKINERVFTFLYPDENNNVNMSNYPLVLDICNRILKSKREDLNRDILYLLSEI